jgi:hypothetical protein
VTPDARHRGRWTVGADDVRPLDRAVGSPDLPVGRLHAVGGEGLLVGRAVCLAPVTLLDPAAWSWPDRSAPCWSGDRTDGAGQNGRMPQVPVVDSPGASRTTASPERNASGGQVIGSTASPRRRRDGGSTTSPVNTCR